MISKPLWKVCTVLFGLTQIAMVQACGGAPAASEPTPAPAAESTPARPSAGDIAGTPTTVPQPTDVPQPTTTPAEVVSTKDSIVLVTTPEPTVLGVWNGCTSNVVNLVCTDATVDPLTWIDNEPKEIVDTSGTERWEQMAPNRWRFYLRQGVKFQNREPWNAEAAKVGIDINAIPDHERNMAFMGKSPEKLWTSMLLM